MMMVLKHIILFLLPRALAPLFPEEPDHPERVFGPPPATSKTKINNQQKLYEMKAHFRNFFLVLI